MYICYEQCLYVSCIAVSGYGTVGAGYYPSAEKQSVYSTTPADLGPVNVNENLKIIIYTGNKSWGENI